MTPRRRALLSVHDKTGIAALATELCRHGYELLSTGGTARLLQDSGLPVTAVSAYTGAPEILDGRVKTLHPRIAGGLLAVRSNEAHMRELELNGMGTIDMVVVNLYPFEETIRRPDVTMAQALENIDIGGPTLIRAAAKNHLSVAVLTSPEDYAEIITELDNADGLLSAETRAALAQKAFQRTASYDASIATWFHHGDATMPSTLTMGGDKQMDLRYGENPHQRASLYRTEKAGFGAAHNHQGKELSYNNLIDLDAAVAVARDLGGRSAVIIKHTNPCGAARTATLAESFRRARATDPVSAFGGVVALAHEVDEETARELTATFLEAIAAPAYTKGALEILANKKNLRVLELPFEAPTGPALRSIAGGLLLQEQDARTDESALEVVTRRHPIEAELKALRFAWIVAKHVKSNAIVFASECWTVGIGAGQMSRVDSARIAAQKAVQPLRGTAVASDAFFPFRDSLDEVARAGATAVIQPGGSMRDDEVIAAADEHQIAMVFTGTRHFRH